MECQKKEMQLADDEDFGSHCLGKLSSLYLTQIVQMKLVMIISIILGMIKIQGNGEHGCGMLWSTLGQVKQPGLLKILIMPNTRICLGFGI